MNKKTLCIIAAIVISLNSGLTAVAKQASQEQSPLVYEYNLKGPKVLELDTIVTTGTINTMSASCDFDGEVSLEASANGGLSYTKITNGQILSEGFIPGNQLRFRVNIAQDSILKKLTAGYTDSSGANYAFRNHDILDFKNQKVINISGANRELFNYPVKIAICHCDPERKAKGNNFKNAGTAQCAVHSGNTIFCEGNIEPDFKDVRFTAADGQTPLAYYLEEIALPIGRQSCSGNVTFWVKIPQIPKEGTKIHLYYGNKNASSASNPDAVFYFFDDFNGQGLNEEKWQIRYGIEKEWGIKDGRLQLKDCSVITRKFNMKNMILEFKAKADKNAAIQAIVRGNDSKNSALPFEEMVYSSSYPGAEHTIAVNDVAKLNLGSPIKPLTDYIYKVTANAVGIIFERYGQDYEKQAEIRFLDTYKLEQGYIGLKATSAGLNGGSTYFDWIRARPYTEVEPKAYIFRGSAISVQPSADNLN